MRETLMITEPVDSRHAELLDDVGRAGSLAERVVRGSVRHQRSCYCEAQSALDRQRNCADCPLLAPHPADDGIVHSVAS
jgi:hypothetical protein